MISAVDNWVGAVLAKLREHDLEEKTLVIFASDNGTAKGSDVDGARNKPLIGHKRNLYKVKPRSGSRKVKTRFNGDVIEWHI